MKLNQATIVIVASLSISAAATSAAASSHEDLKDNLLSALTTHKSTGYLHRMLSITDTSSQCYKDTSAIELNSDYLLGMATLIESCPHGVQTDFTFDYSVCDPAFTASFTEVCTAANGQVVSGVGDISFTCTLDGQTISGTEKGMPECIATSCDVINWEAEKDQLFDEAAKEMEAMLEALGLQCTINKADDAWAGDAGDAWAGDAGDAWAGDAGDAGDAGAGKVAGNSAGNGKVTGNSAGKVTINSAGAGKNTVNSAGKVNGMLAIAVTSVAAAIFF